jgi:hypothetical protein
MASRKRTVEIEVVADTKKAAASLKNMEGMLGKTGKAFAGIGAAIAGKFTLGAITDFAMDSVAAFSNLNESVNAVNVTFGESADGIKQLGEQAAESVGLSNAEFNSLAVGFSAFANQISGAEGSSVVDTMDTLTTRIADFASVMNLDVSEAAEKFRSGLAGETEPLRQFGIDVSAAAVNQKALELGLGATSAELSEQDKILARYKLIMEQTDKVAGDFANTSDELANSQRRLAAKFEDLKAQFGEQAGGFFNEAVGSASNLIDALDSDINLSPWERLTVLFQSIRPASVDAVTAYKDQKIAINDLAGATDKAAAIILEYGGSSKTAHPSVKKLRDETGKLAGATDDAAESTESLAEAQLAAVDPAFNLLQKHEDFVTAQREYNQAVKDFSPNSAQARAAAVKLLESAGGLNAAQERFNNEYGPAGEAALRDLAGKAGIYSDQLQDVLDTIRRIGASRIAGPAFQPPPIQGSRVYHSGGVVAGTPGEEVPAILQAGETVIPRTGRVSAGSSVTVNVSNPSPRLLAELIEKKRRAS